MFYDTWTQNSEDSGVLYVFCLLPSGPTSLSESVKWTSSSLLSKPKLSVLNPVNVIAAFQGEFMHSVSACCVYHTMCGKEQLNMQSIKLDF